MTRRFVIGDPGCGDEVAGGVRRCQQVLQLNGGQRTGTPYDARIDRMLAGLAAR